MAKSQNDLVAAAQTLAQLQKKRARVVETHAKQLAKIDTDIATVRGVLAEAVAGEAAGNTFPLLEVGQ